MTLWASQHVPPAIYTGMLGMMVATGLAVSHWWIILLTMVSFALGTVIRIRSKETSLRAAFGQEFEEYVSVCRRWYRGFTETKP